MQAMSGGTPLQIGAYLFFHAQKWLIAIGYPLEGRNDPAAFYRALTQAQKQLQPESCFAIAPEMPEALRPHIIEKDRYYILKTDAQVPPRLRNPVKKAALSLEIVHSNEFTAAHRRLWAEFLQSTKLNDRVAGLYSKTPAAMREAPGSLMLLDARAQSGNLAASLLLDISPDKFISYIIGAHSRIHYIPHATDLLFAHLLSLGQELNKRFIHLGLGVNDGILRFKRKWGAIPSHNFTMASWESSAVQPETIGSVLAGAFLSAPALSARQFIQTQPEERPFAMLWQLEKAGKISWIAGTAHFFRYSFESSFRDLLKDVDHVIFEGPLDAEFMEQVDKAGKELPQGFEPLIAQMTEAEIRSLEKIVHGPGGWLGSAFGKQSRTDVRWLLGNTLPWYAFFTLWTSFLERLGWRQSVDMEAWHVARALNKNIIGMEDLGEQLESLGSLPRERALKFFRACNSWKARARHNLKAYLAGDLEKMMGSSAEFPTRTEHIVSRRDQRFRERMRPWLEKGGAAVFVGSAHMVNLRHMLAEDGFKVRQAPFGLWPRLHLGWRNMRRPDEKVKW